MHLPKSTRAKPEGSAADTLNQTLVTFDLLIDDPLHLTGARCGDFDFAYVLPVLQVNAQFLDVLDSQRKVAHFDYLVAALSEGPSVARFIHVQLNSGAIGETVAGIIAGHRFDCRSKFDACHSVERLFDDVCLEFTLTRKLDVAKLGTARTDSVINTRGRLPEVFDAIWRGFENLGGLGTAEALALIFIDPGFDLLARQDVRHKHHAPLMASHEDAAVRNFFNIEGQSLAGPVRRAIHSTSVPQLVLRTSSAATYSLGCMTRLVLASTSPARLSLLRAGGIEPETVAPQVDEDEVDAVGRATGLIQSTADMVGLLARAKAEAVLQNASTAGAVVIGCDSSLEFNGETLGKPHDPIVARDRWRAMRGKSGVLYSGHWVIDNRNPNAAEPASVPAVGAVSSSIVHFADLSDDEIDAYVATGEPLKVAGAFTIDGLGGAFLRGIEGDAHTVVGLSLPTLRELVLRLGIDYTSLWNRA